MLTRIRTLLKKSPWLGWTVASVFLVVAALVWIRGGRSSNPFSYDRLSETVTLKCIETGEKFEMPRGRYEKELWERPLPLDTNQGITNPNTGRPTLFPANEWDETIERMTASDTCGLISMRMMPSLETNGRMYSWVPVSRNLTVCVVDVLVEVVCR